MSGTRVTTGPMGELNEQFSEPGATAPPWADVEAVLAAAEIFWLSTVRSDGRPHVTPLPSVWDDSKLHFVCGSAEQKTRNLARDNRCVLTTGRNDLRGGLDVVVEGAVERVRDHDTLVRLAGLWKSELDWDFEVGDDKFHDGDKRDGLVFALAPKKVLAFGKEPYSQTRFRFT